MARIFTSEDDRKIQEVEDILDGKPSIEQQVKTYIDKLFVRGFVTDLYLHSLSAKEWDEIFPDFSSDRFYIEYLKQSRRQDSSLEVKAFKRIYEFTRLSLPKKPGQEVKAFKRIYEKEKK